MSSLSLSDLHTLVTDPAIAVVSSTSDMVPSSGAGTAVAAPTYMVDDKVGSPKIALTPVGPQRRVDEDGTAFVVTDPDSGLAVEGPNVNLDTVGSQATRMENALWGLREELDLPGVTITAGDDTDQARLRDEFDKKWAAAVKKGPAETTERLKEIGQETAWEGFVTAMGLKTGEVSSWTLAHRHVDGHIRGARPADAITDTETVWDGRSEVYTRLTSAGPGNLLDLLHFSPNSVLFGFWLSSGAPINHKTPRAITSEITGYGARQVAHGATKGAPWPATKGMLTDVDGKLLTKMEPSQVGLGQIPVPVATDTSALVTCTDIIATTTVSLTLLRRHLHRGVPDRKQADSAATALVALSVLGRALTLEDAWLRSGCELIDTSTTWQARGRGDRANGGLVNLPITSNEALTLAQEALGAARELGALGTRADSIMLTPSIRLAGTVAGSYLPLLAAGSKDKDDK